MPMNRSMADDNYLGRAVKVVDAGQLHQPKHVGVGPALHLAQPHAFGRQQEFQPADAREAIGKKGLGEIETAPADHIAVDVPSHAARRCDALRIALGVDGGE